MIGLLIFPMFSYVIEKLAARGVSEYIVSVAVNNI
jgi:hypothetical protein